MLLLPLVACRVYDPALIQSPDAGSDVERPRDAGADTLDVVTPQDAADASPDRVDPTDATDADAALPMGCGAVLAAGAPCIQALAGEDFVAESSEIISPDRLTVLSDSPFRAVVSDSATGRLFEVTGSGTPRLIGGTGRLSERLIDGPALAASLGHITGLHGLNGASPELLAADDRSNQLVALGPINSPAPMVSAFDPGFVVHTALSGVERVDAFTLVIANNAIYGGESALRLWAGRPCSNSFTCTLGYDATAVAPLSASFRLPSAVRMGPAVGVGSARRVFVADQGNCRVRGFSINPSTGASSGGLSLVAGAGCTTAVSLPSTASGSVSAASATLGTLGDLALSPTGDTLYVQDPIDHCSIYRVDVNAMVPVVRLVAGAGTACGAPGIAGTYNLGRLAGMALGPDSRNLYFLERGSRTLYRVRFDLMGGTSTVDALGSLGGVRAVASRSGLRSGGVSGLVALATTTLSQANVLWSAPLEYRAYLLTNNTPSVLLGQGISMLSRALPPASIEPMDIADMAPLPSPIGVQGALIAVRDRHIVAQLNGDNVVPLAGMINVGTYSVPSPPNAGPMSSLRLDSPSAIAAFRASGVGGTLFAFVASRRGFGAMFVQTLDLTGNTYSRLAGLAIGESGTETTPSTMVGSTTPSATLRLRNVTAMAYSGPRAELFVADNVQHAVFRISGSPTSASLAAGNYQNTIASLAADGPPDNSLSTSISISDPAALAVNEAGNTLYIADRAANRVYAVDLQTNRVRRIAGGGTLPNNVSAGDGNDARNARLAGPSALAWASNGGQPLLYVGEEQTGRVRVVRLPP